MKNAPPAIALGLAVALAAAQDAAALDATANVGFMSDYIFRGIEQSESAAMGGADLKHEGFYGLVGIFGNDFDGEYYEAGYGSQFEPIGLDWKVSLIHSTEDLLGDTDEDGEDDDDTSVVFQVSKTFELFP